MTTWDRSAPLFQQNLIIEVVSHSSSATSTSRRQKFMLRILNGNRHSHSNERILRIELSNEYNFVNNIDLCSNSTTNSRIDNNTPNYRDHISNNFDSSISSTNNVLSRFSIADSVELYEVEISEQDFQSLRRDQALRIDFVNFAESLIALLMNCADTNTNDPSMTFSVESQKEIFQSQSNIPSQQQQQQQQADEPLFTFGEGSGGQSQFQKMDSFGSPPAVFHQHQMKYASIKEHHQQQRVLPFFQSPSRSSISCTSSMTNHNSVSVPYICRLEIWPEETKSRSNVNTTATSYGKRYDDGQASWLDSNNKKGRLSIIESNRFRELTHISLNLRSGSGESVQVYLSARLVQMLQTNNMLTAQLDKELARADSAEKALAISDEKLHNLTVATEAEKRELRLQAGESAQVIQKKRSEEFRLAIDEKDEIIRALHEKSEAACLDAQKKYDRVETINRKQLKEKYDADAKIDQLQSTLSARDKEIESLSTSLDGFREELRLSEDEKRKLERKLHQSELRIASLEKSNENREEMINKAEALRKAAESAVSLEKDSILMQKKQLDHVQEQLSGSISEINRGNDIIKKIHKDRKETKKKLKSRTEIVRKQEELLILRENELNQCKKDLQALESQLDREKHKCEIREQELNDSKAKLAESAKLLESNQQVIAWLNREINDAHLGCKGVGASIDGMTSSAFDNTYHSEKQYPLTIRNNNTKASANSSSDFDVSATFKPSFDPQFQ